MKKIDIYKWLALLLAGSILMASPVYATYVQKKFVVAHDQGHDVLCDPYIVKKDDYVLKVFKQKGEIAIQNISYFLAMFKRINPEIKDINFIYPNQRILVPLKIIAPGSLEGQETGVVTMPMITITNIPVKLQGKSTKYIVAEGDCVSKLLTREFGSYHSRSYKEAQQIFKFLNPNIKDPNKIRVGQVLTLPQASIINEPWYPGLFDESGKLIVTEQAAEKAESKPMPEKPEKIEPLEKPQPLEIAELPEISELPEIMEPTQPSKPGTKMAEKSSAGSEFTEATPAPVPKKKAPMISVRNRSYTGVSIYEKAARILGAELLNKGEYFFPRKRLSDVKLDLSVNPVLALRSGQKILLTKGNDISASEKDVIKSYWKKVGIVNMPKDGDVRDLLTPICPLIHPNGCDNRMSFDDQGIIVNVNGDYIFDNDNGSGKTCLTLIEIQDQKTPNSFRQYLASKNIFLSEWIDSPSYFGPIEFKGSEESRPQSNITLINTTPQKFVRQFADALGFKYQENIEVAFNYAGFQVKTHSNLLSAGAGHEILVDYGDLEGDALKSAKTTGYTVVQFKGRQKDQEMIQDLLDGLSIMYTADPTFWAAERRKIHNSSVQVPGMLVDYAADSQYIGTLISYVSINPYLISFLNQSGIRVVGLIR